jgi:LysM repeat protein
MSPVFAPAALPTSVAHAPAAVVQKARPAPYGWTTYTVRSGDTLAAIAARTGTTTGVLVTRNHLSRGGNHLAVGQRLAVPKTAAQARADAARAQAAAAARAAAIRRATYIVRSGDTLSAIAARKHVSLAWLLKANRLSMRSVIHVGQRLRIPGQPARSTAGKARPAITTTTYRVRSGDTLSAIAARTRTPLGTLYSLNRLTARSVIHPGQRLRVPVKRAASSTSANTFAGRTYPPAVVNAANRNRAAIARSHVPSRSQTKAMVIATARRHGVDPKLALAVAWQESGWNQRQVSVANAIGVMQVIPSSGQWASEMVGRRLNLLNTQDNITAGVVILRSLTRSAATLDQAIAGYYQGLYSVQKNGMYADTKGYVAAVKAHRARM